MFIAGAVCLNPQAPAGRHVCRIIGGVGWVGRLRTLSGRIKILLFNNLRLLIDGLKPNIVRISVGCVSKINIWVLRYEF